MPPRRKAQAPSETAADDRLLFFAEKASWMASNIKANQINSKLIMEMLMPAVAYLKNLKVFNDWAAPQVLQLKNKDEKEHGQLGAFMAPFEKKACAQSLQNSGKYIDEAVAEQGGNRRGLSKGEIDEAVADDDFTFKVWPMQKIAVCSDEDKFTNLTPISPEEPRIAVTGISSHGGMGCHWHACLASWQYARCVVAW